MNKYVEKAGQLHASGYNCAMSVACAFAEDLGLDEAAVAAMMQGFGTGIGASTLGTCGALVGATLAVGYADKDAGRGAATKDARAVLEKFKERVGAVTCRDIKGIDTGVVLRSCRDCVLDAAEFAAEIIESK